MAQLTGEGPSVALIQEHKVVKDAIAEHREALLRLGWRTVWAPALPADMDGFRAGTAIAWRDGLPFWGEAIQLRDAGMQGRVATAYLRLPRFKPILFASGYLFSSGGTGPQNRALLRQIAELTRSR